jgi:hypothetical protein
MHVKNHHHHENYHNLISNIFHLNLFHLNSIFGKQQKQNQVSKKEYLDCEYVQMVALN